MKFAIAQLDPKVGDIEGNAAMIRAAYVEGARNGADVVVCPESVLTGYPLEDLVLRQSFMDAVEQAVATMVSDINTLGHDTVLVFGTPKVFDGDTYNAAIVIDPQNQPNVQWVVKRELPNYGVFDEKRHFVAGRFPPHIVEIRGHKVGLMICEDCWFPQVSNELSNDGAAILISINGSPYEMGKNVTRRKVIAHRIKETGLPFMYVNAVGGQDELVFDGGSFYYDGETLQEAPVFVEGITYFDVNLPFTDRHVIDGEQTAIIRDDGTFSHWIDPGSVKVTEQSIVRTHSPRPPAMITLDNYPVVEESGVASVYQAIVLGLRDYMIKQGFKSGLLGYSGGVDSGIVAALLCDAIGAENVHLVRMPSKFSSDHSLSDAEDGAERLGCPMTTIPIEGIVDELRNAYTMAQRHFVHPQKVYALQGAADENIQARARGNILMAISNQEGRLLLTTGNKSEVSVGYATLYGDMSGGFNPIKDCYKTMVWALCRWRNGLSAADVKAFGFLGKGDIDVVPEAIIVKPPSAELRADQKDTDSLPPYETLDKILIGFIEREKSSAEIVASGVADEATVTRMRRLVDMAEYKRRQAAPGVKITSKLYGRDRRYPIVNGWRG